MKFVLVFALFVALAIASLKTPAKGPYRLDDDFGGPRPGCVPGDPPPCPQQ